MLVKLASRIIPYTQAAWPFVLERMIDAKQPSKPAARIVLTFLTRTGLNIDGKVAFFEFLPPFLSELRGGGFETQIVFTEADLAEALTGPTETIVVHAFGEDHGGIASDNLRALEGQAKAVFNASDIGPLLGDKLAYHTQLEEAGVPVPALVSDGGFVRDRMGTGRPTSFGAEAEAPSVREEESIRTAFVDTKVGFEGREYFTTVRLLCIDDHVLHAFTRARDVSEGSASVHSQDTPLNPALIEHLHVACVEPNGSAFASIAKQLHAVLGHGFFVHDLLVETGTGAVMVCESGLKFDDKTYAKHLSSIAGDVPSQSPLLPMKPFARRSARVFAEKCSGVIGA